MVSRLPLLAPAGSQARVDKPAQRAAVVTPLGAGASAGAAVVFLMSNGFVTGTTLHADGGVRLV